MAAQDDGKTPNGQLSWRGAPGRTHLENTAEDSAFHSELVEESLESDRQEV
jgi:hypothetical protein